MDPNNEEKKKMNDDLVVFMRKRSETDAPRYTARLKTYVDLQQKRGRAAKAREHHHDKEKHSEGDPKNQTRTDESKVKSVRCRSRCGMSGERPGSEDSRMSRGRREEKNIRARSVSRSRSGDPSDRCCPRRRRRRKPCW